MILKSKEKIQFHFFYLHLPFLNTIFKYQLKFLDVALSGLSLLDIRKDLYYKPVCFVLG